MAAPIGFATSATAQELTWRNGIGTLIKDKCEECHDAARPEYQDWNLGDKKKGSHIASDADFMIYVVWPATSHPSPRWHRRSDPGRAGR